MKSKIWFAIGLALLLALPLLASCAATLKNYDQISLGMTPEQVREIAGKPHRVLVLETTGQGTLLPTPAGQHEVWLYRGGMIQFSDGKVVAKGQKVSP